MGQPILVDLGIFNPTARQNSEGTLKGLAYNTVAVDGLIKPFRNELYMEQSL
jgi:hypothetical protein